MAWTKTPNKPTTPATYPVTKVGKEYVWTEELKQKFCELFPTTPNPKMMELFGISFSTVQRMKRMWNLQHDMVAIDRCMLDAIHKTCMERGVYKRKKGHHNMATIKARYASGWHPLKDIKDNEPERYKEITKRRAASLKELHRKERRRAALDLQQTKIHIPQFAYTKKERGVRQRAKERGYILGDIHEYSGERYIIFYDKNTRRCARMERFIESNTSFRLRERNEKR